MPVCIPVLFFVNPNKDHDVGVICNCMYDNEEENGVIDNVECCCSHSLSTPHFQHQFRHLF